MSALRPALRQFLTARTIAQLRRRPYRYVAWDTKLPCFGVRVSRAGAKSFVVRYRVRGPRGGWIARWVTLGRVPSLRLATARNLAREHLKVVAALKLAGALRKDLV